jgi:hypothetical protein
MERREGSHRQHGYRTRREYCLRRDYRVVLPFLIAIAILSRRECVSGFQICTQIHRRQGQGYFRIRASSAGRSDKLRRALICHLSRKLDLNSSSNDDDDDDNKNKHSRGAYNDDCFGLIFLSGLAVTNDPIFAGTFLALSSLAAVATSLGELPASSRKIPAAVAGFTLLATPVMKTVLPRIISINSVEDSLSGSRSWIEVAVCFVSLFYGFIFSREEKAS